MLELKLLLSVESSHEWLVPVAEGMADSACGFSYVESQNKKEECIDTDIDKYLLKAQWQSGSSKAMLMCHYKFSCCYVIARIAHFFPQSKLRPRCSCFWDCWCFVETKCRGSSNNVSCCCWGLKGTITWLNLWKASCLEFLNLNVRYNTFYSFLSLLMWRLCL